VLLCGFSIGWFYQKQGKVLSSHVTSLTSLVAQQEAEQKAERQAQSIHLLFGGDMMFDREIRVRMQRNGVGSVLENLTPTLTAYDAVIANLEGPVTEYPSRSVGSAVGSSNNFIFTFDPVILPMLKQNNITIVDLGNNHIGNFGKNGIAQTKAFLTEAEISFFGNTGTETQPEERILYKEMRGRKVAFVGHNQFVADGGFETALSDIATAKQKADIVIVMTHWGNEYQKEARGVIVEQAHAFVDAGADVVVGTHPHVVQQHEDYNGKRIYYSLGNFVFDQYFSKETMQGLLVGVEIKSDGSMQFQEIPIKMLPTGQTVL
jgi:poly-gamma-glutamate synthesis protein (capsule biosynthesis protein)